MTFRHTSIREIMPPACANFRRGPMNPSGMTMHVRSAGSASWPCAMSHTPKGSDTSSVQGTTALTAAIHTQLCLNQAKVESWYSATASENPPYELAVRPNALITWMPFTYSTNDEFIRCSLEM